MALIPRMFRPSVIIRRKAMYAGFLGPSKMWKVVGIVVFGRSSLKKFFGKQPEVIDKAALGSGRVMELVTAKPVTRRRRKQLAKQGITPLTLAEQRGLSVLWAEQAVAAKSKG